MRTKEYVEQIICSKSMMFKGLEGDNGSTNLLLHGLLTNICYHAARVARRSEETGSKVVVPGCISELKTLADKEFLDMAGLIREENLNGKRQTERTLDLIGAFYSRFMEWFLSFIMNAKILSVNANVTLPVIDRSGERVILEDTVPLIIEKGGVPMALILNIGKNSAKLGLNARKAETKIENNFRYSVIKTSLEVLYPGINLVAVYFQEGENKGKISEWVVNNTTKTNVVFMPFEDCYEDGQFEENYCLSKAEAVLLAKAEKPTAEKCANCPHREDCLVQTYSDRKMVDKDELHLWQVPDYDKWQQAYVDYGEGKVLVLAGPGSGKTASSMGRVKALAGKGVPSEKILLVTYTEKAAGEMKARLRGHFPEDEMPKISTLHGIASEIINLYEKANDLPLSKPLSKYAEKKNIENVLNEMGELSGVSYRTYKGGKFNTVNTVYSGLNQMQEDREMFFSKHSEYVPSEWDELYERLEEQKRKKKYVSFDELLELAADILKLDNTIRTYYYNKYDYIIVDEYQDANAPQDRLVNAMNGKGNLACVGDDDQSVFRFNGSSPEYVHRFKERHPDADVLLLPVNYRTTRKLVEFNNHVLSLMDHSQRIDKQIQCGKYAEEGVCPIYVENNEPSTVDMIIQRYVEKGYAYSDIAVVATVNKSLIMLNDRMRTPTELASAYIVSDFLFNICKNLLSIVLKRDNERDALIRIGHLMEKDEEWFKQMYQGALSNDVHELIKYAEKMKGETPEHFVARMAVYFDLDESPSDDAVLSVARYTENLEELYEVMKDMLVYGDEKKVEYPIKDRVTLITAHSCKGKEWPVVILYDTDAYEGAISEDDKDSMDLRLFYVASTRAMKELCFMKNEDKECILDMTDLIEQVQVS